MNNTKWISSKSKAGRVRSFDAIANFALCNAIAEGLAFTALDAFGIKGKRITHTITSNPRSSPAMSGLSYVRINSPPLSPYAYQSTHSIGNPSCIVHNVSHRAAQQLQETKDNRS